MASAHGLEDDNTRESGQKLHSVAQIIPCNLSPRQHSNQDSREEAENKKANAPAIKSLGSRL